MNKTKYLLKVINLFTHVNHNNYINNKYIINSKFGVLYIIHNYSN